MMFRSLYWFFIDSMLILFPFVLIQDLGASLIHYILMAYIIVSLIFRGALQEVLTKTFEDVDNTRKS